MQFLVKKNAHAKKKPKNSTPTKTTTYVQKSQSRVLYPRFVCFFVLFFFVRFFKKQNKKKQKVIQFIKREFIKIETLIKQNKIFWINCAQKCSNNDPKPLQKLKKKYRLINKQQNQIELQLINENNAANTMKLTQNNNDNNSNNKNQNNELKIITKADIETPDTPMTNHSDTGGIHTPLATYMTHTQYVGASPTPPNVLPSQNTRLNNQNTSEMTLTVDTMSYNNNNSSNHRKLSVIEDDEEVVEDSPRPSKDSEMGDSGGTGTGTNTGIGGRFHKFKNRKNSKKSLKNMLKNNHSNNNNNSARNLGGKLQIPVIEPKIGNKQHRQWGMFHKTQKTQKKKHKKSIEFFFL